MTILSIPPFAMSVIAFYIGIYHFLTYLANRETRSNLTFSLMCFAIGLYNVCCVGNYNSTTFMDGYEWQRMQLVTIALVALGLLWFIVDYTHIKNKIVVWFFTIFFSACALVEFFDRSDLTWIVSAPNVKTFLLFGHSITYNEVSGGIFTDIEAFGLLLFFTYIYWLSFYFFWKRDTRKGWPLILAVTLFYLTMFEDVMVTSGFYNFVYTLEYGYVGFLLIMAYSSVLYNFNIQKKLRQSEEGYRLLVEGTENFVTRVDNEGKFTFVNQASEKIYGLKPEECIGLLAFDFIHPDDRARTKEAFDGWLHDKAESIIIENRQVSKSGEVRNMLWTCKIEFDESGQVAGVDGIAQDITNRKQAEEELLQYASIVSCSKDMMAILDSNYVYLATNEAYLVAFGLTKDQVVGHTVSQVFGEEFFDEVIRPHAEQCLKGNDVSYDDWFQFPVHGSQFMTIGYSPFVGKDGDIKGFTVNARNITERKQAEQEREKLMRSLESKNEELQSIVYISSHDLKSPLVNITGFSAMLDQSCKEVTEIIKGLDVSDEVAQRILPIIDEDIPQSLKFISAGTHKMKMLLDGLLQVSRVGNQKVDVVKLDMNKLIHDIADTFAFQIKERDVSVTIEDLPECRGDVEHIHQVFSNLVGNALKYLSPERQGSIKITGEINDKECIYCIEDNGIGIHKDHQSKVFELFHRLNPDDSTDSQGLGLTITKRSLDRNGGWTWVESEPDKGSKFFVSLPSVNNV